MVRVTPEKFLDELPIDAQPERPVCGPNYSPTLWRDQLFRNTARKRSCPKYLSTGGLLDESVLLVRVRYPASSSCQAIHSAHTRSAPVHARKHLHTACALSGKIMTNSGQGRLEKT